jgi:hypothetical protein
MAVDAGSDRTRLSTSPSTPCLPINTGTQRSMKSISSKWITSHRHHALAAVLISLTSTGCATAMSAPTDHQIERPAETNSVPLKFDSHNFDVYCYNVTGCHVVYNNHNFSPYAGDSDPETLVSGPPRSADYRDHLDATYVGVNNFPAPMEARWKSLDGATHEVKVDIGAIFKDELILHRVPASDLPENVYVMPPDIIVEINDRTINVFMKAFVPTKTPQIPGNERSTARDDLILAWSRTY